MDKTRVSATPTLIDAPHLTVSSVLYTLEKNKKTCKIIKDNVSSYSVAGDKQILIFILRTFDVFWPKTYQLALT